MRIHPSDTEPPHIAKLVGQGSYITVSDFKGFMAQRNGDGSIRTQVTLQVAETWLTDTNVEWTNRQSKPRNSSLLTRKRYTDSDEKNPLPRTSSATQNPLPHRLSHPLPVSRPLSPGPLQTGPPPSSATQHN
ncbi:hypothetical protein N7G274_008032 [Stereocaulon virgatum]|uniref:Uncharacterized protein n=1 Tax=Stereocaulon virgatum TaxID=373712 RepID=A0ABR4A3S3_9LECA